MPRGRVELIQVRPRRLAPTVEVEAWERSVVKTKALSAQFLTRHNIQYREIRLST
jgi:hypothetical protein